MNSRVILNLFLVVVVAGLALVAYFKPGIEKAAEPIPLLSIAPADINRIRIMPAAKQGFTFEKKGTEWQIVEPIMTAANSFRLDALLKLVHTPIHKQYEVAQSDLAKFKLAEPAGIIQFNNIKIAFGDSEPINNNRYVMVDDKVYLITDNYFQYLTTTLASFVDNRLLPPESHIASIELPDLAIKAIDGGRWSVSPEHAKVSADAVQTLVDAWRDAQALQVSHYQEDKVQGKVTITLDNHSAPIVFQILEREPELILGREDISMRYHFPDDQAKLMMQLAPPEQSEPPLPPPPLPSPQATPPASKP